ncbi:glycosyltransferase family 2 protein [Salegentibacter sp. LM13S]|uniref:glycosyltransferase family 2 protein n=1 Tax=Salegentibacter lacus TaxID=2873599 RepID=UPI001CCF4DF8|nr:glycosyltransferase family A protein [Salegentibacter lacus]MBZ9632358.1 glycosyltransferase family 2 protein [Salegentibacter lacus]
MQQKLPLLSIIIPCYNDLHFIQKSVDSALGQTYPNKEIIIIDDGSNNATKEILRGIEPMVDLLITQENKGLSSARNAGIKKARGEYILVLDSDDFFEPQFAERALEIIISNPQKYKIITCQAHRFNKKGTIDIFTPKGGNIKAFLFSNSAIGNSLFKKADWESVDGYDEKMTNGYEDWEFFIRLLKEGGEAFVILEPWFNYRQKENSMRLEANKVKFDLWEYIFLKHSDLYKNYFDLYTRNFLTKLKEEEREKIKNTARLEFRLGNAILKPLRILKSQLKWRMK